MMLKFWVQPLSPPCRWYLLEGNDVGVLEFAQVFDVRLLLLPDLLDGHLLGAELAQEHGPLRPTAQPLQLRDLLKRNLPHV